MLTFKKYLLEKGMNSKSQIGMLSKEHFDKKLKSGEIIKIGNNSFIFKNGEYFINNEKQKRITPLYQKYRKTFKES